MRAPWTDKTGVAKLIAISASTLGIATGLCGLNFVGAMTLMDALPKLVSFFIVAGYLELIVMAGSFVALIVFSVISVVRSISHKDS